MNTLLDQAPNSDHKTGTISPVAQPIKHFLKDYRGPDYQVDSLKLEFELYEEHCLVTSEMKIKKLSQAKDLWLDGEEIELVAIFLNEQELPKEHFQVSSSGLRLLNAPNVFQLKIQVKIYPKKNTALEGLYQSGDIVCTQCEAQSFRRITYFMDRPDVMTHYEVRISADKKKFPILLSNGNRTHTLDLPNGRHSVTWIDPHKKPCYLFALVAGDLGVIRDRFQTRSGRQVDLEIYAPHGSQDRCHFAMESLKKSMAWDEVRFDREYDLANYMILAVDDFNAGAMENKGLNIFNSRLILADPKSATDEDFKSIESVVAHEYFHNWTGNRITLRDWFHLSLKEGLTVFRDQEFSMDVSSRDLVRIESVSDLRSRQFAEDAGPNSHPIRPESCYSVDNFFTSTIYEKGSEVIRMMQTLVGRPGFKKGMDLYFEKFDGKAVIIEDFAACIEKSNGQNWEQFKLWYSQAGTPRVKVKESFFPEQKCLELELSQTCADSTEQKNKLPFHIPLQFSLIDPAGQELRISADGITQNSEQQYILNLREKIQKVRFENLPNRPLVSINRNFSAPIILERELSESDTLILFALETDLFNKWDMGQSLFRDSILKNVVLHQDQQKLAPPVSFLNKLFEALKVETWHPGFRSKLMTLPEVDYLVQFVKTIQVESFQVALECVEQSIAVHGQKLFFQLYSKLNQQAFSGETHLQYGNRSLKNMALSYLAIIPEFQLLSWQQFQNSELMTDSQAALEILVENELPQRDEALAIFYQRWQHDQLVLNKWFAVQAEATGPSSFQNVVKLTEHPLYHTKNPNRVYSLLRTFGRNILAFHNPKVDSYGFMADQIIELDKINPQVATRLASCFDLWNRLPQKQMENVHLQLQRMLRCGLSSSTFEIVSRSAQAAH